MLTIGQLAAYAGVTVRAVRHYHQVGLLPEPDRDASGYRRYGPRAVVQLIRIRTLADAGVPLARVRDLLDADEAAFAAAVDQIDRRLRAEIRELQEHRRRIRELAAGDALALPVEVTDYLALLRATGAPDVVVEGERDAWILVAARWPDLIPAMMAEKRAQLEDPRNLRLYQLLGDLGLSEELAEEKVVEAADLMAELIEEAHRRGDLESQALQFDDSPFEQLLDTLAHESHPALLGRLQELLAERGWTGWSRNEPITSTAD